MPEYLSPGVYMEEVPARLKAIEGVSTSTAGFVGAATRGPVPGFPPPFEPLEDNVGPVLVTSFAEYVRRFGSLPEDPAEREQYLGHSVRAFFGNGGRRCYVCRVVNCNDNPAKPEKKAVSASVRVGQGNVLGLQQRVRAGEDEDDIVLTAMRNIAVGAKLKFLFKADGSNALTTPAQIAGAKSAPFAMSDGQGLKIKLAGGTTVDIPAIHAKPAEIVLEFRDAPLAVGASVELKLRVGADTEPEQTISFDSADFVGLDDAATLEKVFAILAEGAKWLSVSQADRKITLTTNHSGDAARLRITGGTAIEAGASTLFKELEPANAIATGEGDVADIDHVTIQEIIEHFGTHDEFSVTPTSEGRLRITSTALGDGAELQVEDDGAAGAVAALGLPTEKAEGKGEATLTVTAYDTQAGSVKVEEAPMFDLDPDKVFVIVNEEEEPKDRTGPRFYARDPGGWGARLQVLITPSQRFAVGVPSAVPSGTKVLQVNTTATFYRGAIVEIDHGGERRYGVVAAVLPNNTLELKNSLELAVPKDGTVRVIEIDVTITDAGSGVSETYSRRTWNPDDDQEVRKRHYATVINEQSRLAYVQPPGTGEGTSALAGSEDATVTSQPITFRGSSMSPDGTGDDKIGDDGDPPSDEDVIGTDRGAGARSGIQALQDIDDIRLIAAPGRTKPAVQTQLISQCVRMRYRFALLDGERAPKGTSVVTAVQKHRNLYDTSFAGYYTPWVEITSGERRLQLPPSGYVAGICARVDNQRGVWKAPANEVVQNITGLRAYYTAGEQDILNPRGVNCIRRFEGRGLRVWGARTLSSDPEYRYVNVRRFLIFMGASIDRGTQWVVFEPNAPETWDRVVTSVTAFLHTQWRDGALLGRRPEDAFWVRCDESTMTADDIQNGRLICNIGVAIVRPAEFVIFRIEQIAGLGVTS